MSSSSPSQPQRLSLEAMLQICPCVTTDNDAFCRNMRTLTRKGRRSTLMRTSVTANMPAEEGTRQDFMRRCSKSVCASVTKQDTYCRTVSTVIEAVTLGQKGAGRDLGEGTIQRGWVLAGEMGQEAGVVSTLTDLTLEAGMAQGTHNVGVVQVLGNGHLHGGPIWGALYVLVLLWSNNLQAKHQRVT